MKIEKTPTIKETRQQKIARAVQILSLLQTDYPNAGTELDYKTPFELLIAVILSAQCTDRRVNEVTKQLFSEYNSPEKLANIDQDKLEKIIFSCGFYRAKAKNIISCSRDILEKFGGEVPRSREELTTLAGVGRKTANVILSVAFNQEAFAVDTHVFRVSRRLGFSTGTTPDMVEDDVTKLLKDNGLGTAHHLLIFHGRYCCHSRVPSCNQCSVSGLCPSKISK